MRRIFALIIALVFLLPCFSAFAARTETVYAADNQVQVYASKSTSSKKLGKLSYGQSVICTNYDEQSNGWAKIKSSDGDVGYCKMKKLTDDNPNRFSFKLPTKNRAELRAKPNSSSKLMARFTKNVSLKIVAMTEDCEWFRVKYAGRYGYVKTSQMGGGEKKWYVGNENVGVLNANGVGENTISYGESLYVLYKANKYAIIRFGNKVGYCNSTEFADKSPCTLDEVGYVVADGARLYSETSAIKAYAKNTLAKGEKVSIVGETDEFYCVKYKNTKGYMLKKFIDKEKPEDEVIVEATQNGVCIYKDNLYGETLATVDKGESLLLNEVKNVRALVTTEDGITGWAFIAFLELK